MRVYIGKYINWIGPFQIAGLLQKVGVSEDRCYKIGSWLSETKVDDLCQWIHKKRNRTVKVKIHVYDTWSMDSTLAPIIVPMLKQLKATKHGIPMSVVPEGPEWTDEYGNPNEAAMEVAIKSWDEILDKMIFSFESKMDDEWESKYFVNGKYDQEGHIAMEQKIQEGFELFGKHFSSLWD